YPPEDLLLRKDFLDRVDSALADIAQATQGITAVIGFPERRAGRLFNSAAILKDGNQIQTYQKRLLPNYGVFDEKRYFDEGMSPCVFEMNGMNIGLTLCEDIWHEGPVEASVAAGADLIVSLNASPFHSGKLDERHRLVQARAISHQTPIIYLNLVGGQDELVFDGASFAIDSQGTLCFQAPEFKESV
ncbi:MAG TPA: NAD+ synthase, partial [Methylococcaceae bacterium]|nr:NAD+ synthase [Methylococcaceae bacterium]